MSPEVGAKVIAEAKKHIGSHYINGAYGATPGKEDGCPCRPGGIKLIADPSRLNPNRVADPHKNLAVFAAEMTIKKYCVCAGNSSSCVPRWHSSSASDPDLVGYLDSLKGKPVSQWTTFMGLTPRRAFGPGQNGDRADRLVWGKSCQGVRHFDCVGFISFCYWKATGSVVQLDISAWRKPNQAGAVFDFKAGQIPGSLLDGDILVKADHHIAFVDAGGTVYEAQDTDIGVTASPGFSLQKTGSWTHLVRVAAAAATDDLDWPLGWWKVWDGNTYYYFFAADGSVKSTKTSPPNTRKGPAHFNNQGRYKMTGANELKVTWNKVAGAPASCVETFYNAKSGCEQMNATSTLYSPLVATRLA